MKLLVVDIGTSGVRAAVVTPEDGVVSSHHREVLPSSPAPGMVEFDAVALADAVVDVARVASADAGEVAAVGIANQRASTVVWDRTTGEPVGPGLGWQDLPDGDRLPDARRRGLRLAPNLLARRPRTCETRSIPTWP
ncbi:MAG: FGGY family carbohydrate kinase [Acidimicrobiales bacterium]